MMPRDILIIGTDIEVAAGESDVREREGPENSFHTFPNFRLVPRKIAKNKGTIKGNFLSEVFGADRMGLFDVFRAEKIVICNINTAKDCFFGPNSPIIRSGIWLVFSWMLEMISCLAAALENLYCALPTISGDGGPTSTDFDEIGR